MSLSSFVIEVSAFGTFLSHVLLVVWGIAFILRAKVAGQMARAISPFVAIILAIAIWRRDRDATPYLLGLSIPGALASLYQAHTNFAYEESNSKPRAN